MPSVSAISADSRSPGSALGVIVVRRGVLPAGADEVTAEAGGRVLLVGDGVARAATGLTAATEVTLWEAGEFAPAAWSAALATGLDRGTAGSSPIDSDLIIMPASPDGRDFAPRLAAALRRQLVANAVAVRPGEIVAERYDGRLAEHVPVRGPVVATLVPGVRGVAPHPGVPRTRSIAPALPRPDAVPDAEVLEVLAADPATIALTEAPRIVGGGHGMGSREAFSQLSDVAAALGASLGGTRVVADLDWIPFERQIGTTGAIVAPRLYLAFGVSGAVQHTSGLGSPDHVISVNVDGSAPMMAMADLAIIADAPAVVAELRRRLAGAAEATAGTKAIGSGTISNGTISDTTVGHGEGSTS